MKTILIVEDTEDYSDALKHTLTQKGYNVVVAATGQEGLAKAISEKPDLILMDVMLPDQDGAETVLQIKEQPFLTNVRIVFLTALTSDSKSGDNTIMVQGWDYPSISKMLDQDEIVKRVAQYLAGL